MNYRHAYHAGNFADVLKHAVVALVIEHLKRKEAPFRVIDTHAGAGRYALASVEAAKTGEWRDGIGRLLAPGAKPLPNAVAERLRPYLEAVHAENAGAALATYPGSPSLALRLMRADDRLIANELHEDDRKHLEAAIGRDARAKVMGLDGWVALKSLLPPKERRGVILVDPPFEEPRELERLTRGLADALARFATGTFILGTPSRTRRWSHASQGGRGHGTAQAASVCGASSRRADDPEILNGCGLLIVNGPYTLKDGFGRAAARAQPSPCARSGRFVRWAASKKRPRPRENRAPRGSAVCVSRAEKQARNCLAAMQAIIDTPRQFGRPDRPGGDC